MSMTAKITIQDGEDISSALSRFKRQVDLTYRQEWHKRRLGYYEKPSILKRKKMMMRYRKVRLAEYNRERCFRMGLPKPRHCASGLKIGLVELFHRSTPVGVIGR